MPTLMSMLACFGKLAIDCLILGFAACVTGLAGAFLGFSVAIIILQKDTWKSLSRGFQLAWPSGLLWAFGCLVCAGRANAFEASLVLAVVLLFVSAMIWRVYPELIVARRKPSQR